MSWLQSIPSQRAYGWLYEGKVAIVTGAGGGIGRDIALAVAREGAKVVVNDVGACDRWLGHDAGPAQHVVDEIQGAGGQAVATDASPTPRRPTNRRRRARRLRPLDAVVNNAGILRDRFFHRMSVEISTSSRWTCTARYS